MNALLKILVAVVLAAWVAVPSPGSEGGENAGSTGVWVLPRASFVGSGAPLASTQVPRKVIPLANLSKDVQLEFSVEVGAAVGTMIDCVSGVPIGLSVAGNSLLIPASMLQSLLSSGVTVADILIVDANQMGYQLQLVIHSATSSAVIRVF